MGVVAIDQKGGGKALMQTRLYVYPETDFRLLHKITLGDKSTQKDDIAVCRDYVQALKKLRENEKQRTQKHARIDTPDTGRIEPDDAIGTENSQTNAGEETRGDEGR